MDYGEILGRSWQITWNNKFLWLLGFLAALTSSAGSSFGGSGDFSGEMTPQQMERFIGVGIAIFCIALIVGLLIWLISLAARGGLIYAVDQLDEGLPVTLGDAFGAGRRALWRMVGAGLLLFLPVIVVAIFIVVVSVVVAGASFAAAFGSFGQTPFQPDGSQFGPLVIGMVALICCLAILVWLVSVALLFIYAFAVRGIVLRDLGAIESLSHGWRVVRNNLAETIVLSLIFFFIQFGFSLALFVIALPVYGILLVAAMRGNLDPESMALANMAPLLVGGICLGLIFAALRSLLVAWQSTAFTLAYRQFIAKPSV